MEVEAYKHKDAKRKNIPPSKIAAEGIIPQVKKVKYAYSPHLSPLIRFDSEANAEKVSEIEAALSAQVQEKLHPTKASGTPWS